MFLFGSITIALTEDPKDGLALTLKVVSTAPVVGLNFATLAEMLIKDQPPTMELSLLSKAIALN